MESTAMSWSPDSQLQQLAELRLKRRLQEMVTRARTVREDAREHYGFPRVITEADGIYHSGVDHLIAIGDDKLVGDVSKSVVTELIGLLDSLVDASGTAPHEPREWVRSVFTRWREMVEQSGMRRHAAGLAGAQTELDIQLLEAQLRDRLHQIAMAPQSSSIAVKRADVFISHASEDKESVARPLAEALRKKGYTVWLDEAELTVGDNLFESIDHALSSCRYGVVILSPDFFRKKWPRRELAALAARADAEERKTVLPIWHNVDQRVVAQHSPLLAAVLGINSAKGWDRIVVELARVLDKS